MKETMTKITCEECGYEASDDVPATGANRRFAADLFQQHSCVKYLRGRLDGVAIKNRAAAEALRKAADYLEGKRWAPSYIENLLA